MDDFIKRLRNHPEFVRRLSASVKVYAEGACLIAASYGECFGLPLIEAVQRHKLPIIARDNPIFREVR